ncbi:hypothetical protein AXF42_Ash004962 [Apostasia shenzhenica]|uniref:Uncharacterized protein n=1 Tax=Apostasia shenzhenica TaxID=1088818 RepID=A0A2I0B874_9ASPA|nr:hypothetical protein AXF42_Ash004962 [Apostasia shenzhenica]
MLMMPTFNAAQKGKAPANVGASTRVSPPPDPNRPVRPYPPAAITINAIFNVDHVAAHRQVVKVDGISHQPSSSILLIFCHEDLPCMGNPHNDPIVVTSRVADFDVRPISYLNPPSFKWASSKTNLLHAGTREVNDVYRLPSTQLGLSQRHTSSPTH